MGDAKPGALSPDAYQRLRLQTATFFRDRQRQSWGDADD